MSAVIYFSIPVFLICIALELFVARRRGQALYGAKDSAACLSMGLGNVIIAAGVKTVTVGFLFVLYEYRLWTVPADAWWAWVLILFAEDFCYYWFHRFHHEVRLGWAAHVNHHSSQYYNLAVALRQSWTTPITGFMFWWPLALLGFHPLMILTQQAVSLLYQFWIHTEAIDKMPRWFEAVMNTPSHHRVHVPLVVQNVELLGGHWWRRDDLLMLVEQGMPQALVPLGTLYESGFLGEADMEKAVMYFSRAAEAGIAQGDA